MAGTVTLRIFLAGRVAVEADGDVLDEGKLAGRQGRLVFAYLVAERGRPVPRDELAEALWGSAPPATWDKALTVIASKLRAGLSEVGVDGGTALTSAFGGYRLDLPEGSWVDVTVAEDAADAAEQALRADQLEAAKAGAASAVELLRQPFLPGETGTWVEAKRRELADVQGRALNVLAEACLRLGDAPEAVKRAEQALALEPFRETGYRRLMEAHAAAGNRAEALQVYERCRRLLAEELGAYPSPETEAIYRQLLAAPAREDGATTTAPPGVNLEPAPQARRRNRRTLLVGALAGVIAAAVAVPLFAFSSGESGATQPTVTLGGNAIGAVSVSTGHIVAATALAASPEAIAAGAGSTWVAMSERGIVSRISEKTNSVQQTVPTHGGPSALAFGAGFVWVANTNAGTVVRIDPRANGGQVVGDPISVGNAPSGIAYGLHAVWVANSVDSTVVRIDPVTGSISPPISVEGGADGIAVGDRSVWVIGQSDGVLSRIDPIARAVAGTTSINEPAAVAVGPDAVWVASAADGTVSKINPSTGHVEGAFPVGKQPSGVAVGPDGHVWVASAGSATLSELDPATGHVIRTAPTGAPPSGVALDGNTAYVAAQVPPSSHRGGTLTLVIANKPTQYSLPIPTTLDPGAGYSAWELLTLTNDGLLGYSRAGGSSIYKIVPDLATSLGSISDGGLTYTFQLRKGIRYSTGGVVEPADIRRGIERALLESGNFPKMAPYLDVIVGGRGCATGGQCDLTRGITTSPGSSTVTFHLTKPDPDFRLKLALPEYDAVPASTPLHARLPLPATGPYKIAGWRRRGVIVLVRNPVFRVWSTEAQPPGYPDKIVERFRYTGVKAIRAVEQGTADITAQGPDQTWPPALAKSLQTRYVSQLYPEPQLLIFGLWLNTRLAPFNDRRVRQALNLAVDRNRLAQINGGAVACQFIPPGMNGYSYFCPYKGPNLTKARRLVAESGTKGQSITLWIYDIGPGHRNGRYLVSVLSSIGYKARVEYVPHGSGNLTWRPGRQAGVQGWGGGDYPSTSNVFLSFLCSSITTNWQTNGNYAGLCDRRLDAQVARAVSLETSNPAAAAGAWHRADRMVTDEAPWVPLKVFLSVDFVARRVGNYRYCWLSTGTGLTGACLDQLWVR